MNLRKVKYKRFIQAANKCERSKYEEGFQGEGLFHCWGYGEKLTNQGYRIVTLAFIELEDGSILKLLPYLIRFTND